MISSLPLLPPFLPLLIGALAAIFLRGHLRSAVMLLTPIWGALQLAALEPGLYWAFEFLGYQLEPVRVDKLSLMFGYLFHLAAFIAVVYALHLKDTVQHVSGLSYAASAVGAVFAGDLLTLFVCWELLALTSVFLIWARRTDRAYSAGMRYIVIKVLSGVLLLAGAIIVINETGSAKFSDIGLGHEGLLNVGAWLIFVAFGIKCAFPFAHTWLTDSYPEATPTGTIFLASFTTKVAVYALARGFAGTELLVWIGVTMACFPIFYAVIENDLRRVLAYSMINQIGFMVVGVGIGTSLALNGAVAHAFNDVIFKGLLMMTMGAVLHMTGKINGSELGGLYKTMPKTTILCIVGAASISAFPLFSGFVSKSMIMSAAIEQGYDYVWLALLFAAAGVFHHAGIKIPYFAFFAHDSGIRTTEPPKNMLIAMTIAATLCVVIGTFPAQTVYALLPWQVSYQPYDLTHILTQLQLLFFSALAFVWLNKQSMYPPELPSTNLDSDWLYRKLAPGFLVPLYYSIIESMARVESMAKSGIKRLIDSSYDEAKEQPKGYFAQLWPTETMVFWVALLLAGILLLYYI
ncbi:Na(+)/H(+) antiporter subunit D [Psychrobium sp. 1_MG-2023]|uniref:Na(+)/H(+) antiporter subunit D n=1 Tax=Psychrobium sp. 1_MG-2023 TaxID=3062624 RepID=UPI000C31EF9C|nr:Na(+)/H(+) antiporter subunit D [Psychrobium sp. 1_MG-2023]MDP2560355.1 Na(+)/H(+) antiporter subunit D [Psychrobium sp. 1_MG-2023]PKF55465.1 Na(+)/H(+) antiporter subunit D [Alteromonadales bacterium alter-6D02]